MQIVLERPSAKILPFIASVVRLKPELTNRLTAIDRIQALHWARTHASPVGARLEIHDWHPEDGPDMGDYIGIYRAAEKWLAWGVARDGATITVWNGATGADLGKFDCLNAALAALSVESIQSRGFR